MKLQEQSHGAVLVIRPDGALIGADADDFKKRVLDAMTRSLGRCVVDVGAVPFVDSRGLEALVEVNEQVGQSGQPLKLCGMVATVRQVLELTKLSSQFEYFEDVTAAARSFL